MTHIAVIFLLAIWFGAAASQPTKQTHNANNTPTLAHPAQRVISLAPHLTEMVFAAGGADKLVGVIRYSDYPPAAKELPLVGDAFALNFERIAQLKPDLLLVWRSGVPERQRDQLLTLNVAIYESEIRRVEDIAATLHVLGKRLGSPAPAKAAAREMLRGWQDLQIRYSKRRPVRVFYQLWHQPLMTVSGTHLIDQAISTCGGVNVFASLPALTPTVSWEAAAQANPQLIASAGISSQKTPQGRWAELGHVDAVKYQRYARLPPELMSRMGPRFVAGARLLCEAIDSAR